MTNPDRMQQIQQMLEENPDDSFLKYAAALELRKSGDTESSAKLMEEILAKDNNYLAAYYQLGKLYEEMGDRDNAAEIYKQGQQIANEQGDTKALTELSEALAMLEN